VPSAGASSEATGEAGAPADEAASASEGQEASEKRVEVSAAYLGELERKAGTADEYLDLLQRVQAEFDNYRKRQRRDLENERRRIKADLLVQLVEILVNLERARDAVAASTDDLAVIEGVELILKQVNDLLAREGAERIVARGRKFDPEEHEALQQMAVDGVEPGVVVEEVSPGVRVDGVVVKAARVIVSA
jgi:molecular chaperone GrpE